MVGTAMQTLQQPGALTNFTQSNTFSPGLQNQNNSSSFNPWMQGIGLGISALGLVEQNRMNKWARTQGDAQLALARQDRADNVTQVNNMIADRNARAAQAEIANLRAGGATDFSNVDENRYASLT